MRSATLRPGSSRSIRNNEPSAPCEPLGILGLPTLTPGTPIAANPRLAPVMASGSPSTNQSSGFSKLWGNRNGPRGQPRSARGLALVLSGKRVLDDIEELPALVADRKEAPLAVESDAELFERYAAPALARLRIFSSATGLSVRALPHSLICFSDGKSSGSLAGITAVAAEPFDHLWTSILSRASHRCPRTDQKLRVHGANDLLDGAARMTQ